MPKFFLRFPANLFAAQLAVLALLTGYTHSFAGENPPAPRTSARGMIASEQREYALRLLPLSDDLGMEWHPVDAVSIVRTDGQWAPANGHELIRQSSPAVQEFLMPPRGGTRISSAAAYAVPDADGQAGAQRLSVTLFLDRFPAMPLASNIFVADMDATFLELGEDGIGRAQRLLGRNPTPPRSRRPPPPSRTQTPNPIAPRPVATITDSENIMLPLTSPVLPRASESNAPHHPLLERLTQTETASPLRSDPALFTPTPIEPALVLYPTEPSPSPNPIEPALAPVEPALRSIPDEPSLELIPIEPALVLYPIEPSPSPNPIEPALAPVEPALISSPDEPSLELIPIEPALVLYPTEPSPAPNPIDPALAPDSIDTSVILDTTESAPAPVPIEPPLVSIPAEIDHQGFPAKEEEEAAKEEGEKEETIIFPEEDDDMAELPPLPNVPFIREFDAAEPMDTPRPSMPLDTPSGLNGEYPEPTDEFIDKADSPIGEALGQSTSGYITANEAYASIYPAIHASAPSAEGPMGMERMVPLSFAAFDPVLESIHDEASPHRRRVWLIADGLVCRIDASAAVPADRFDAAVAGVRRRLAAALAFDRQLRDESLAQFRIDANAPRLPDRNLDYVWNPNAQIYWNAVAVVGGVWVLEEY